LSVMPPITDPKVLIGSECADDAAVYRLTDELALVQTLDFFTPIVDDPYTFGAIAAANALSDVYAMGGRPITALNIVCFPKDNPELPLSVLAEIMRGGADKAREAGIDVVGGHTVDDPVPKYGLAVTGLVSPKEIWANQGGKVGDRLVLTKPIGSGVLTTALRAGTADAADIVAATSVMAALNRRPAEIARAFDVHGCTDVTGFGLLGHLSEMLRPGLGARINANMVPLLSGALDLAERGKVPGGTRRNREAVDERTAFASDVDIAREMLLCDAQSSGGLLFAVSADQCQPLLDALRADGLQGVAEIGSLTSDEAGAIEVVA
jgi:selenide, water dikinase